MPTAQAESSREYAQRPGRESAAVRDMIGLTGQFAAVDELLTRRENLEMFGRLFKLIGDQARRRADHQG
jgi:ABC-2 type transport system ATP-binding protein